MIEARQVGFSYEWDGEEEQVLKGMGLVVKRGEWAALLGCNGSGKSTFAKLADGLLPFQEGSMTAGGLDVSDPENIWKLRRRCGIVFQNPDNQFVTSPVEADVAFGLENYGTPRREIPGRVKKALEEAGLSGFEKRMPRTLSGGQKQRAALAGVLALEPELLIFDEATSMLDPGGRREVLAAMENLHRAGKTVLMITHYVEEAALADRVFVMRDGRVQKSGAPREILTDAALLKSAGLLPPMPVRMYEDLKRAGIVLGRCPLTKEELCREVKRLEEAQGRRQERADGNGMGRKRSEADGNKFEADGKQSEADGRRETDAQLTVKGACCSYRAGGLRQDALREVFVQIRRGEFVGIMGKTGSGKSTLLKLIGGLTEPERGTVFLEGEDIFAKGYGRERLRQKVGIVFQYPEYQLFGRTVEQDVMFGLKYMGLGAEEKRRRVREALEAVGFSYEAVRNQSPLSLSGGEKRRAAIAGVLAAKPEILMLDEPFAGLDPMGREAFGRLLKRLNEGGTTVLVISHNADALAECAGRLLILEEGRIVKDGSVRALFSDAEEMERLGLSVSAPAGTAALLGDRGRNSVVTYEELKNMLLWRLGRKGETGWEQ